MRGWESLFGRRPLHALAPESISRRTLVKTALVAAVVKTVPSWNATPRTDRGETPTPIASDAPYPDSEDRSSPRNLRIGKVGTDTVDDTSSLQIVDDSPRRGGGGVEVLRFTSTAAAISALTSAEVDCFFDATRSTPTQPEHQVTTVVADPRTSRREMIEVCLSTGADGVQVLHVQGSRIL